MRHPATLARALTLLFALLCAPGNPARAASAEVENALATGNVAGLVSATGLIDVALAELQAQKTPTPLQDAIFGTRAIAYTPGNRSQLVRIQPSAVGVRPLLSGNGGNHLAVTGMHGAARFAAFGAAPMESFQAGTSLGFQTPFKRTLAWLIGGEPVVNTALAGVRRIALSFTTANTPAIKGWIAVQFPDWQVVDCNTAATLATCYQGADLVITGWQNAGAYNDDSQAATIVAALDGTMTAGTPLLYLHTWYEATNGVTRAIGDLLGIELPYGGNYWANDGADWASAAAMTAALYEDQGYAGMERMLGHLKASDYAFDWSACAGEDCSLVPGLAGEFLQGAQRVRAIMNGLDGSRTNAFARPDKRLERALALLGDLYRRDVTYPMDKVATDDNAFLRAYYADHAVYNFRRVAPAPHSLGDFSRTDFSAVSRVRRTVRMTSKRSFRAAGVYALPGQTVKITRNDASPVGVKVFINTLRSGSTHEWAVRGYTRPKFLQSAHIPIDPGQTIRVTSVYGGPLELEFDTNDQPVSLTFANVGLHPVWNGPATTDAFTRGLDAGQFDWAELITPAFEVHSQLSKMRESVTRWGTPQDLAAAAMTYIHDDPHALAGFQGPGIHVFPEAQAFADARGWVLRTIDQVQHMNADAASCGYGCSGNPYDAYWAFDPIGHGDIHELGHGLQSGRISFEGWENHTMTNPYSYYSKYRHFMATGGPEECQSLPYDRLFGILQTSVGQPDPAGYVQANLWAVDGWSEGAAMFHQLLASSQNEGRFQEGRSLLALLHILQREFDAARTSVTAWDAKRASLGFGDYSQAEANAIGNNDWLLIAASLISGSDLRDYFGMWALPFTAKAGAQVAGMGLPAQPRVFYALGATAQCSGLKAAALPVDGAQAWPGDSDADGVLDPSDNCLKKRNLDQRNADGDARGDACDADADNDGVRNAQDSDPLDPRDTGPVLALTTTPDPAVHGLRAGADGVYRSVVRYTFRANGEDRLLHLRGFDIDGGAEVGVYLNGALLGALRKGINNGLSPAELWHLPAALQRKGLNRIDLRQQAGNGTKWGVSEVALYPAGRAFGNLKTLSGGDRSHADGLCLHLPGDAGGRLLGLTAYDSDRQGEIVADLNGSPYASLPKGRNDGFGASYWLILDGARLKAGDNRLCIQNALGAANNWGVRIGQLGPLNRVLGRTATMATGDFQTDRVSFLLPDATAPRPISLRYNDVDRTDEVRVRVNGALAGFAAVTGNDAWGAVETITAPAGGTRVLEIDNRLNPPNADRWGVRVTGF